MKIKYSPIARRLLGLDAEAFPQLAVERFGPQPDLDQTWSLFEPVASTLVETFYLTLDTSDLDELADQLDTVAPELRGIAYEGAGMGLMMRDLFSVRRWRLDAFLHGRGADYRCLIYIGAGLVLPRMPVDPMRFVSRQDPLLGWLVLDGYGFFDAFFNWQRAVSAHQPPANVQGYGLDAYDQGLGRSLWFSTGADVGRIVDTITGFQPSRRANQWSGVGLACAYAAGVMDSGAIAELQLAAGPDRQHMATGAAIATIFRQHSQMPAPHTDLASQVIWDRTSDEVADLAQTTLARLPGPVDATTYAQWRRDLGELWLNEQCAEHGVASSNFHASPVRPA